ncbi:aconitate hydratase [Secundilactobacillus collinoides]|nr:aconitate hydratase [Secundilactobacillus collinoides]KZL38922.1 aconitate hydratase [Secundilactobacillus collinoides]
MGLTVAEKCIQNSIVYGDMTKRGSRIGIHAHQTLGHDLNAIMTFLALNQLGIDHVKTELSVQYMDHNMIQADYKNADDHRFLQEMTAKYGVVCARPGSGICHQLHLEHFGIPGKTLIGGDSHTPCQGGLGMFAVGVGGFDAAMAMAGEPLYIKMPYIINIHLTGHLPAKVSAKNVILEVLRRIDVKGGVGKVLEYSGPGVKTLNVAERSTITNMGAETGATTSIFPSDENTKAWMRAYHREEDWIPLSADEDAHYDEVMEINLNELEPLIALPSSPGKVVPVREVAGRKIDQVMLGSCTNTALNDMKSIANIMEGHTISDSVDAALYPSTRTVIAESIKRGYFNSIVDSGVRIFEPMCGGCNGCGFAPQTKGVSIRTTPRNFPGRSGTKDDQVYLAAPETAAVSAITGEITDPRDVDIPEFSYELPDSFIEPSNLFYTPHYVDEVHYGPNLKPIPKFGKHDSVESGEVLLKLPDNITTDHICPAGALYLPIRSNIPEISKHSFMTIDLTFPDRAKAAEGGVLVAGENYGQGSSREQAAIIPRFLGIKAILAKDFARLHLANLVNWGVVPLTFKSDDDYQAIDQGDTLTVKLDEMQAGQDVTVINETKGATFTVSSPLSTEDIETVKWGGRLNQMRNRSDSHVTA